MTGMSNQRAGGVAGLLYADEVTDGRGKTKGYYYKYDGNGNVTTVTNAKGRKAATYRYDAFGKTLAQKGNHAEANKYRFSTKPIDEVSSLYYYGYRYYDPQTGRWPSRDPIEESGGLNLYGFVNNNCIDRIDYLGLSEVWKETKVSYAESKYPNAQGRNTESLASFFGSGLPIWVQQGLSSGGNWQYGAEVYYKSSDGKGLLVGVLVFSEHHSNGSRQRRAAIQTEYRYKCDRNTGNWTGPTTTSIQTRARDGGFWVEVIPSQVFNNREDPKTVTPKFTMKAGADVAGSISASASITAKVKDYLSLGAGISASVTQQYSQLETYQFSQTFDCRCFEE